MQSFSSYWHFLHTKFNNYSLVTSCTKQLQHFILAEKGLSLQRVVIWMKHYDCNAIKQNGLEIPTQF